MYKSERLELRLTAREVEILDTSARIMGVNRSALIRSLIRSTEDWIEDDDVKDKANFRGRPMTNVPLPELEQEHGEVLPAKITSSVTEPHRHRRGERLDPPRWVKGSAVYSYRCAVEGCGKVLE